MTQGSKFHWVALQAADAVRCIELITKLIINYQQDKTSCIVQKLKQNQIAAQLWNSRLPSIISQELSESNKNYFLRYVAWYFSSAMAHIYAQR